MGVPARFERDLNEIIPDESLKVKQTLWLNTFATPCYDIENPSDLEIKWQPGYFGFDDKTHKWVFSTRGKITNFNQ